MVQFFEDEKWKAFADLEDAPGNPEVCTRVYIYADRDRFGWIVTTVLDNEGRELKFKQMSERDKSIIMRALGDPDEQ